METKFITPEEDEARLPCVEGVTGASTAHPAFPERGDHSFADFYPEDHAVVHRDPEGSRAAHTVKAVPSYILPGEEELYLEVSDEMKEAFDAVMEQYGEALEKLEDDYDEDDDDDIPMRTVLSKEDFARVLDRLDEPAQPRPRLAGSLKNATC